MERVKGRIFNNLVYNFLKTGLGLLFPLITFTYASRILSVKGIGKVNFAQNIVQYFSILAQLGMVNYGAREAAKIRDDKWKLSKFVQEMFLINSITTAVSYLMFIIAIMIVPKFADYRLLLWVCSASIVLNGVGMEWLYNALEEYRYIMMRSAIFQIAALIMLFMFVRKPSDAPIYAAVLVFAQVGSYVLNFWHSSKYIFWKRQGAYSIRKHLKPIITLFGVVLSINLYTALDISMLGFISGDEAVGLYSAAEKVNKLVISLITSLGTVLMPRLSFYIAQGMQKDFYTLVGKAYRMIFLLSFPAMAGVLVLSREIILLLSGTAFMGAVVTMRILSPILLVIPFSVLTNQQILVPMREDGLMLQSTCTGACVNLLCNLFLIPRLAQNGAALGTVIAETTVMLVCLHNANRFFPMRNILKEIWKYAIATVPIFLIRILVRRITEQYLLVILLCVSLGAGSYFFALYLFRDPLIYEIWKKIIKKSIHH